MSYPLFTVEDSFFLSIYGCCVSMQVRVVSQAEMDTKKVKRINILLDKLKSRDVGSCFLFDFTGRDGMYVLIDKICFLCYNFV